MELVFTFPAILYHLGLSMAEELGLKCPAVEVVGVVMVWEVVGMVAAIDMGTVEDLRDMMIIACHAGKL